MHEWTREEHIADILRDDPSTPRTAEIIGTYYWRESRGTVDDDRDIIEPMRSFERENATLKSELTAAKQSREQAKRDAQERAVAAETDAYGAGQEAGYADALREAIEICCTADKSLRPDELADHIRALLRPGTDCYEEKPHY